MASEEHFTIVDGHPSLYNADLAPLKPSARKWGAFEIFNVWSNDIQSLFGYTLAATLFVSSGLNGWWVFAGIILAGPKTDSPVIVQASAGARKYAGSNFLKHMILAAIEEFPDVPVCMHQDHGTSPAVCQRSIALGFSSVMMDGSLGTDGKTPTDYDYNVDVTRRTVEMAHACGVSVEGELGCLGSLETGQAGEEDGIGAEGILSHEQMLTDPDEAAEFVKATNVDALAIACGTSHGAYKFTKPPMLSPSSVRMRNFT